MTNEAQRNEDTVKPLVRPIHPFERVRQVIIYALWRKMNGDCPTDTAWNMRVWQKQAEHRYKHDNAFHYEVEFIAHEVMDAAAEFYRPNKPNERKA